MAADTRRSRDERADQIRDGQAVVSKDVWQGVSQTVSRLVHCALQPLVHNGGFLECREYPERVMLQRR